MHKLILYNNIRCQPKREKEKRKRSFKVKLSIHGNFVLGLLQCVDDGDIIDIL